MAETQKHDLKAVTDTPEFKAAVQAAAASAVAEMIKTGKSPATLMDGQTEDFFARMSQTIAMAVAEISDQGTNRKRVSPEILAKRADAKKRLDLLMAKVSAEKLKPEYRLVAKVYLNERLIEPYRRLDNKQVVNQEIIWTGVPNDAMRPINGIAHDVFAAYRESVGAKEHIATEDHRPNWVTPAGLVVKGDSPQRAIVNAEPDYKDDLAVRDNNDPNAPFVHVLGTVAPAARRNVSQFPQDPANARPGRAPAQDALI
jgi:hypothetical protein